MQQRTPNSATHTLLQRMHNFGPFESWQPHLYLQCTASFCGTGHRATTHPRDRGGVSHSKHRPSPSTGICAQAHDVLSTIFFQNRDKGGKNLLYINDTFFFFINLFTVIGTEPAVLLHQELDKFKRWGKISIREERGSPSLHHQEPLYVKTMSSVSLR